MKRVLLSLAALHSLRLFAISFLSLALPALEVGVEALSQHAGFMIRIIPRALGLYTVRAIYVSVLSSFYVSQPYARL